MVVGDTEPDSLDVDAALAVLDVGAPIEQLFLAHGEEAQLVEETQQPRTTGIEPARRVPSRPDLHRAAHELVPARPLHAVHAQVRAADADRVLGVQVRAGLYFVVTSRWRGSTGVATGRRGTRRPDRARGSARRTRCGGCRRSNPSPLMRRMNSRLLGHHGASARTGSLVPLDRKLRLAVVPGHRQVDDARRDLDLVERRRVRLGLDDGGEQLVDAVASGRPHLERPDAGRELGDRHRAVPPGRVERVGPHAEVEVEHVRPELDEQVLVAGRRIVSDGRVASAGSVYSTAGSRRRAAASARRRRSVPSDAISRSAARASRRVVVGDRVQANTITGAGAVRASSGRRSRPSRGTRNRRDSVRRAQARWACRR